MRCGFVAGVLGPLALEDVFPIVGDPGAAVFPLRVAAAFAVVDLDPAALEDGFAGVGIHPGEPGDDLGGLRLVAGPAGDVVVGERHVEGIEAGREAFGAELAAAVVGDPGARIGVVVAPEIDRPLLIPG